MIKKTRNESLPRLTWIAEYDSFNHDLALQCGRDVEVGDYFAVEGVWDGQYENLDYDTCDHFFGSGLKMTTEEVIVTPSTGLVDRVFVGESKEKYFISNSLVELLARTKSNLVESHNYKIQTDTIQNGINDYIKDYPVLSATITSLKQYFYHPVSITNNTIIVKQRPNFKKFISYDQYISTISSDLKRIYLNASSPRRNKTFDLYTTISKGYDSTATTVLTANFPIRAAFTSKSSNSSVLGVFNKSFSNDDGTEIAKKLGLNLEYLDFNNVEIEKDELYFLSATTGGPELQFYKVHKLVSNNKKPAIVFTGYHGDTVWDINPPSNALTDDILKPGASGLTLSEIRLKSGFINIPVPMMHARSIVSINSLSKSENMSKWSVGGDYDRPIPRRIVESYGVKRNDFGERKKAIATFYNLPINKTLRKEFLRYMEEQHNRSATIVKTSRYIDLLKYYSKMIQYTLNRITVKSDKVQRPLDTHMIDTPYYMHIWSLSRLVETRAKELFPESSKDSEVEK